MARELSRYEKAWRERSGHAVRQAEKAVPPASLKASAHTPPNPARPVPPADREIDRPTTPATPTLDDDELERLTAPRPPAPGHIPDPKKK
jgi:hypothetical protein